MALSTVIEFTDTECRVVSAERAKNRLLVRNLITIALPSKDDREERIKARAAVLERALKEKRLKPSRVSIIIPKNFVMARTVVLPATTDEEVAGMAKFETDRHIPVNADRHISSHQVLRRQGVEGCEVLLAAVDHPIVAEYTETCVRAGLQPGQVGVSSLAAFNALVHADPPGWRQGITAIMNIGPTSCDFAIARDGVFTFTRGAIAGTDKLFAEMAACGALPSEPGQVVRHPRHLAALDALAPGLFFRRLAEPPTLPAETAGDPAMSGFYPSAAIAAQGEARAPYAFDSGVFPAPMPVAEGGAMPADPEHDKNLRFQNWLLHLIKETRRTYEFGRREYQLAEINRLYLCGEGAAIHNLAPFMQNSLGVTVTILNPFDSGELAKGALADPDDSPLAYAACAGTLAAPASGSIQVNLLPPEYTSRAERKRQQHSWIVTGLMALVLAGLTYMHLSNSFAAQRDLRAEYVQRNEEIRPRVSELKAKEDRLQLIKDFVQDQHGALEVLERVSAFSFIPAQATVTRIEYRKEEYLKVAGHAKTLPDVNRMRLELEQTGFFASVTLDEGSNKPTRIAGPDSDQVLEYYITATFPKRTERQAASPAPTSTDDFDEDEE